MCCNEYLRGEKQNLFFFQFRIIRARNLFHIYFVVVRQKIKKNSIQSFILFACNGIFVAFSVTCEHTGSGEADNDENVWYSDLDRLGICCSSHSSINMKEKILTMSLTIFLFWHFAADNLNDCFE